MYKKFYGLKEKPFSIVPNPEYLYFSKKHKNALTMLEYGLSENAGFILLTGEIGAGKTTLIKYLLGKIEADTEVAVVFNTNVSPEQLMLQIVKAYDLTPSGSRKSDYLETYYRFLIEQFSQHKQVLLIIDEAQNLPDEALEELRMLNNLQTEADMLLRIMIVGQPELQSRLKSPYLAALSQRIAVKFHLGALSRRETCCYIAWRLEKAGGKADLFSKKAMHRIHELSEGIPRSINLLCNAALVYGFADGMQTIGTRVVELVIEDEVAFNAQKAGPDAEKTGTDGSKAAGEKLSAPYLLKRIEKVEGGLKELRLQMTLQFENLQQAVETSQQQSIINVQELLQAERKISDNLLLDYGRLQQRYRRLKKYLEHKTSQTVAALPPAKKPKKSFWHR